MPHIFSRDEIASVLNRHDILNVIEQGFVRYSDGDVDVPPTSMMTFEDPPADVHMKMGHVHGDPFYVVKVSSGFYNNSDLGIPSSNGVMLVFERANGQLAAVLLDEGLLTDMRSAAAGAIAARYLAPTDVECIGIVGTGIQARLQLEWLQDIIETRDVVVWGRTQEKLKEYIDDMGAQYTIKPTLEMSELTRRCRLIVTTTATTSPLLFNEQLLPGTHITALGADRHGKQELDPRILYLADILVADSISQAVDYGEASYATELMLQIRELGSVIANPRYQRRNNQQLTVADLTGVAVQDAQIATLVYRRLLQKATGG